jgi:hypothetical protein
VLSLPLDLVSMRKDLLSQTLGKIALKFIQFFSEGELLGNIFSRLGQARSAFLTIVAARKIKMAAFPALEF